MDPPRNVSPSRDRRQGTVVPSLDVEAVNQPSPHRVLVLSTSPLRPPPSNVLLSFGSSLGRALPVECWGTQRMMLYRRLPPDSTTQRVPALGIVAHRADRHVGRAGLGPFEPLSDVIALSATVTVVIPTLNEARDRK